MVAADAAQREALAARYAGTSLFAVTRRAVVLALARGLDVVKTLLPMAVFFIKFLQWWYVAGHGRAASTAAPIPPPPDVLPVRTRAVVHRLSSRRDCA
jgi:hypothetical protein